MQTRRRFLGSDGAAAALGVAGRAAFRGEAATADEICRARLKVETPSLRNRGMRQRAKFASPVSRQRQSVMWVT
jgi:hypothetical protein